MKIGEGTAPRAPNLADTIHPRVRSAFADRLSRINIDPFRLEYPLVRHEITESVCTKGDYLGFSERTREKGIYVWQDDGGQGKSTYSLFSKYAANRRNDFMFCPECTSEMGEALSYITRVILFVSVVIANAR